MWIFFSTATHMVCARINWICNQGFVALFVACVWCLVFCVFGSVRYCCSVCIPFGKLEMHLLNHCQQHIHGSRKCAINARVCVSSEPIALKPLGSRFDWINWRIYRSIVRVQCVFNAVHTRFIALSACLHQFPRINSIFDIGNIIRYTKLHLILRRKQLHSRLFAKALIRRTFPKEKKRAQQKGNGTVNVLVAFLSLSVGWTNCSECKNKSSRHFRLILLNGIWPSLRIM